MNSLKISDAAAMSMVRGRNTESPLSLAGKFKVEIFDKDGKLKYTEDFHNDITNVGKNSILGVQFHADTQITAWYTGIVDNAAFSAFAAGNTMSSHSGWAEFTTYSQSTRVQWSPGSASSQSITNGTPMTFDITGSGTLKGIFIVSESTKGGTTGTLWSTAAFTSTVPVTSGDQLKVTYTVNA